MFPRGTPGTAGNVVCSWGRGEDGQLGHGDADEKHTPTIITALQGCEISSITCGADHTTARSDSNNTVYSWGWSVKILAFRSSFSSSLYLSRPLLLLLFISVHGNTKYLCYLI
jgi:hypothetical protein